MKLQVDRAIEAIARARAPKEPPTPAGPEIEGQEGLERPACGLCGNTRAEVVLSARDTWIQDGDGGRSFEIVRCEVCGHRYTTPRFRREVRERAFEGPYPFYERARRAAQGNGTREVEETRAAARAPFEGRADRLCTLLPQRGRVLDLGCGDGFFLDVMQSRGWDCVGIDVETSVVWHARERLGLDARAADVETTELPEGPFDAITMWGMLQLAYAPRDLLERLRDRLTPDGVLAVGVSNFRSVGRRLFGRHWRGLGVPRHLSHFTPDTLRRLLDWTGYEVLQLHLETPRWIVAQSADDQLSRPLAKVAKLALLPTLSAVGHRAFGDTMEVYARPQPRARSSPGEPSPRDQT